MSDAPEFTRQSGSAVRFGWGASGLAAVGPGSDAIVIVDVLSFATAVDVALGHGIAVVPSRWRDARAAEIAAEHDAILAGSRGGEVSLSPTALARLSGVARIVLPSPNGSTLAAAANALGADVYVACLRNAHEVARAIGDAAPTAVIAAGELWPDGSLRPALEDLLGAGAVIDGLGGRRSPEAAAAAHAFAAQRGRAAELVWDCASGRELREIGYDGDVRIAGEFAASTIVPRLADGVLVSGSAT